jgi:hypothetical protein
VVTFLVICAVIASSGFFVLLVIHELLPTLQTATAVNVQVGDGVVYRKQKVSTKPSPRAYDIHPAGQGDSYQYFVDKYWTVENVLRDGRIVVRTRTNKHHYLQPDDPNLRKAGLIVRLRFRKRFPELLEAA